MNTCEIPKHPSKNPSSKCFPLLLSVEAPDLNSFKQLLVS